MVDKVVDPARRKVKGEVVEAGWSQREHESRKPVGCVMSEIEKLPLCKVRGRLSSVPVVDKDPFLPLRFVLSFFIHFL